MSLLDEEDAHLILILDELEALIEREGSAPLYSLSRIQESRPSNSPLRLSLICVFRIPQCEDALRSLDTSTRGTLGHRIIDLDEYGSRELLEILDHRVKESFKENAILDEAVNLIADIASQPNSGSARAAVELTYLSGKCADNMGVSMVLPMHVRMVQPHLSLAVKIEDLETLRKHERLLLLAIARLLARRPEEAYVGMGETERMYSVICEEFGKEPRRHTQVWKYVRALSSLGLITTKISGSGIQGKTTLIGLPLPAIDFERELFTILKGVS
jgi:cell division control protein 6